MISSPASTNVVEDALHNPAIQTTPPLHDDPGPLPNTEGISAEREHNPALQSAAVGGAAIDALTRPSIRVEGAGHTVVHASEGAKVEIYKGTDPSGAPSHVAVNLVRWQRTSSPGVAVKDEFCQKLDAVKGHLNSSNFVVLETRLPALAEDLFEGISSLVERSQRQFEAASSLDSQNEPNLAALATALASIEPKSICYLDLHGLSNESLSGLRTQLGSDPHQLTRSLRRADAFCVVATPRNGSGATQHQSRVVTFSYAEEEAILINRASFRAGEIKTSTVNTIRSQISRSVWGEQDDRLRLLDDLIRSGKVEARIEEYEKTVGNVDEEKKKYEARLEYLIGLNETEPVSHDDARRLRRVWSEPVTFALVEHALFVMTSFDQLMPGEFDFLMRALLDGKHVTEYVEELEWISENDPIQPKENQHANAKTLLSRKKTVERQVLLDTAYMTQPDALLALIDVRVQESGALNFDPLFKAQVARHLLRSRMALKSERYLIERTLEKSILFDAPIHIAEQLADRYVEHVSRLSTPMQKVFIANWMDRSARHFIEERKPNFKDIVDADAPILALFIDMISREYNRELSRPYSERASVFLSRLLTVSTTHELADYALHRLMEVAQNSEGKYDLVLMFVRALRRYREFNALHWLKRLLSEGDDEAKKRALDFLAGIIESGTDDERINVLKTLCSWLPSGEQAFVLNNQTAALLAPRVAMHRMFARRKDRERGKVDQVVPLFDLSREGGVPPELPTAIKLLTASIGGTWIHLDLDLLDQLIGTRWGLELPDAETSDGDEALHHEAPFPALSALDDNFARQSWTILDASLTVLVGLLIEAVTLLLGNPEAADKARVSLTATALAKISTYLPIDVQYAAYQRTYSIWKALSSHPSQEAQVRAATALWIGDALYRAYQGQKPENRHGN